MVATGWGNLNALGVALAAATAMLSVSQEGRAQSEQARRYDIPAGDLGDGLKQFGVQSGLQLLAPPQLTHGLRSPPVAGTFTAAQVLERLLAGSGLTHDFVNATTVVIRRSAPAPAPADSPTPPAPARGRATRPTAEAETTTLEAMTVTGTRIRGGTTPSPVITIGSERIQEEGFADLGEVIRAQPQNFSGGQNPGVARGATNGAGGLANQNITGGASVNLRGLGPDASLTLLNGRRMAFGGFTQAVDISAIPVEAVERIEIVPDGASAIYGSDAVGGVANVILKREFEGVAFGARSGVATDGGLATHDFTATAGGTWSSGGLIATYKDASSDPIYARQRDYTSHMIPPTTIYPGTDLRSGLLSVHQRLGESTEVRLDALRTEREQLYNYYFSTFLGPTSTYNQLTPETTTSLLAPAIEFSLPNSWTLSIAGAWGKDEHLQDFHQVSVASGESRPYILHCWCNKLLSYEVGAEGPLFAMGERNARLAIGAGYRKNEFQQFDYMTDTSAVQGSESSRFAYAELNLPLVAPASGIAGIRRLELTAAVRGEDYDSFGSVTTPKLGMIYAPSADVTFKASWGRSFKAPTLLQQFQERLAVLYPVVWFNATGYPADAGVLGLDGGNPDLAPERARTWSASLAIHPVSLPGLEAELSWFDVDYTDRVVLPIGDVFDALGNPLYSEFVRHSPTGQEQDELLAAADEFLNFTGTPYDPGNVVALMHTYWINASRQRVRGLDFSGSYRFDLGAGQLTLRGSTTWLSFKQQTTSAQPIHDLTGVAGNPARINSRLGVVWSRGGATASTFVNYTSGVATSVDDDRGGSFTTLDGTLRYTTANQSGPWSGWTFALSLHNMLDRAPPLLTFSDGTWPPYDSTNYSAIGRFVGLSVSKQF